MDRLHVKPAAMLDERDRAAITELLDTGMAASAYQFPFAGNPNEFFFLVERNGKLCFSGRGSVGYMASRWLPFLRLIAFNRGPAAASHADLENGLLLVKQWARREGYCCVRLMPELDAAAGLALAAVLQAEPVSPSRYTVVLDITASESELLAAFPSNTRYRIRRAGKEGVTVRHGNSEADLQAFLQVHGEMTGRKGLPGLSHSLLQRLWTFNQSQPDRMMLIMAEYAGELLGANLVFRTGTRAEYLFGAVSNRNKLLHGDVTAGYPLQWGGILWAKAAGCTHYDFGGFDPALASGPALMKKAFFRKVQPLELSPALAVDVVPGFSFALRKTVEFLR